MCSYIILCEALPVRAGVVYAAFGALGTAKCVVSAGYFVATAPRAFAFSAGEHAHRNVRLDQETCICASEIAGARSLPTDA